MIKLTIVIIIGLILMMPDFANSMMKKASITQPKTVAGSGGLTQATSRHSSPVSVEPMRFVKHWWNVTCSITDTKGRGRTFDQVFRVCANFATTARIAANNDCEKQYSKQYGWNCCTCKGQPQDTGSSCNN